MRKKNTILYTLSLLAFMINECLYSQESLNPNQTKKIFSQYNFNLFRASCILSQWRICITTILVALYRCCKFSNIYNILCPNCSCYILFFILFLNRVVLSCRSLWEGLRSRPVLREGPLIGRSAKLDWKLKAVKIR